MLQQMMLSFFNVESAGTLDDQAKVLRFNDRKCLQCVQTIIYNNFFKFCGVEMWVFMIPKVVKVCLEDELKFFWFETLCLDGDSLAK